MQKTRRRRGKQRRTVSKQAYTQLSLGVELKDYYSGLEDYLQAIYIPRFVSGTEKFEEVAENIHRG